jgi:hypothetical protein
MAGRVAVTHTGAAPDVIGPTAPLLVVVVQIVVYAPVVVEFELWASVIHLLFV